VRRFNRRYATNDGLYNAVLNVLTALPDKAQRAENRGRMLQESSPIPSLMGEDDELPRVL
jgi:hypothetical protein